MFNLKDDAFFTLFYFCLVVCEITLTDDVNEDNAYRLRTSCEEKIHEILGLTWIKGDPYFTPTGLETSLQGSTAIGFEQEATLSPTLLIETRLSGHGKAFFLSNDLSTELPFREQESLGIPSQSFQLASTPALRGVLYGTSNGNLLANSNLNLPSDGHFKEFNNDGNWWIPSGKTVYDLNPSPINPLLPSSATNFYTPLGVEDILGNQTTITFDQYQLFPTSTTDALGNSMTTTYDYRVLQPNLVIDLNDNQTAVAYDILGIVVKMAVMETDAAGNQIGDTLANPTSIMDYDFSRWQGQNPKPNYIRSRVREEHHDPNHPNQPITWQESYEYSDGSGGVIMAKVQTKNGEALKWQGGVLTTVNTKTDPIHTQRWIGNGRTILDNKGNPIKQYEPYFSVTHEFEDAPELVEIGHSPILYYDAAGRNNRTVLPDGSLTRVEFDAWQNTSFDVNDTIAEVDNTWVAPDSRIAALVAQHANTPTQAYLDCLGRTIYAENIAPNGVQNTTLFTQTDMAGRYSKVYDQLATAEIAAQAVGNYHTNRGISSYSKTDLLGQVVYTETAVKGKSYALTDAMGRMLRIWDNPDSVNQSLEFRTDYDVLHRPLNTYVKQGTTAEICFAKTSYGENLANAKTLNLRGQAYKSWDQAGLMTSESFDFKGNPLSMSRQLTETYDQTIDWNNSVGLEQEIFRTTSKYDALNRPTFTKLPDGTEIESTYNRGGYLENLRAKIMGQGNFKPFLLGQDYDAKGQKQWVKYGNETITKYFYEAKTFRLANLISLHTSHQPNSPHTLQDLQYKYDPTGNIMEVVDKAQSTFYYNNNAISPEKKYEYDHLYRLTKATGREHEGSNPPTETDFGHLQGTPSQHINTAVRKYTQSYEYDAVDNIISMKHQTGQALGNWTHRYKYAADATNRLVETTLGNTARPFSHYDIHGNMTKMPHLQALTWNFADQLTFVEINNNGYNAYYNYDGGGQRIRKVVKNGLIKKVRLYLGGVEQYRVYTGNTLKEETWTLQIDGIAQVDTKTVDNTVVVPSPSPLIRYQYSDHLGSATLETDENAAVISYEEYHPYGTTAYSTYVNGNYSTKRYRFTNKERDDETGLYYFGVRYYAAWLGRWTSSDPGGFIDGLNLYRYVRNNPVMLVDEEGFSGIEPKNQEDKIPPPTTSFSKKETLDLAIDNSMNQDQEIFLYDENTAPPSSGYVSALNWAFENLVLTNKWFFAYRDWGVANFGRYRREDIDDVNAPRALVESKGQETLSITCSESCTIAYAQGNEAVANYLEKEGMPANRFPQISFFKKGGKHHSLISAKNFTEARAGDILHINQGELKENGDINWESGDLGVGHAVLLATDIIKTSENSYQALILTTNTGTDYGIALMTFSVLEDGSLKPNMQYSHDGEEHDKDRSHYFIKGFGRVNEYAITKEATKNIFDSSIHDNMVIDPNDIYPTKGRTIGSEYTRMIKNRIK